MMRGTKKEPGPSETQFHTLGYSPPTSVVTRCGTIYGVYVEMTMGGSWCGHPGGPAERVLSGQPSSGRMARTKTGSLILTEDSTGAPRVMMNWSAATCRYSPRPSRMATSKRCLRVHDPEGQGVWTDDFTTFQIRAYDLDGGDVSAVNNGANPYTDIAGSAASSCVPLTTCRGGTRGGCGPPQRR